ncbi:MAG: chemotaxis protein CheW [Cyanobacteria bacterium P01_D01_bin.1]
MSATPLQKSSFRPLSQPSSSLTADARLRQLLPELFNPTPPSGKQFLRVQLSLDLTIAVALDWIEESLQLPAHLITPIPNMAASVLGLMSTKGQVFWAVDLIKLMNLPLTLKPSQSYEVVVIRADSETDARAFAATETTALPERPQKFLGLIVPGIRGTIRLQQEQIASPWHKFDPGLQPYLSGQAVVDEEIVAVLSAQAIASAQALEVTPV